MMSQNICKFVTFKDKGQLIATNFIFESKVPYSGQYLTQQTHGLYLVNNGEGLLRIGNQCFHIFPGYIFFSFANITFTIENIRNLEYFYIQFQGSRADDLFQRFGITPRSCVFEGHEGLLPLWHDSLVRANEENIDLLSAVYLFKIKEIR